MSATKQQALFHPPKSVMTVSQLTGLLRTSIESQFADLWLEGEVSNLRMPGYGHVYCTLKDEFSQIRAVLSVLHRWCPTLHIILAPVPVQGECAAQHIANAVALLN